MYKLFVHQKQVDEKSLEYFAGRIYLNAGRYFIGDQQRGAEEIFTIGQPIYDTDNFLMGYMEIALHKNLDYAGRYNGLNIPAEGWAIGHPTAHCQPGKKVVTYWQRWAEKVKHETIDIKSLTEADKGRWVIYSKIAEQQRIGRIKSWNESHIFVVYKCDEDWDNYADYTAEATSVNDLIFKEKDNE